MNNILLFTIIWLAVGGVFGCVAHFFDWYLNERFSEHFTLKYLFRDFWLLCLLGFITPFLAMLVFYIDQYHEKFNALYNAPLIKKKSVKIEKSVTVRI